MAPGSVRTWAGPLHLPGPRCLPVSQSWVLNTSAVFKAPAPGWEPLYAVSQRVRHTMTEGSCTLHGYTAKHTKPHVQGPCRPPLAWPAPSIHGCAPGTGPAPAPHSTAWDTPTLHPVLCTTGTGGLAHSSASCPGTSVWLRRRTQVMGKTAPLPATSVRGAGEVEVGREEGGWGEEGPPSRTWPPILRLDLGPQRG